MSKIRPLPLTNARLGFDMGPKNLAFGVYANSKKAKWVKASGMMQHPISDLTKGFDNHLDAFHFEYESLLLKHRPKLILAERFISRGLRGGTIEKVCIMLGLMATVAKRYGIEFKFVTPAAWKNSINRVIDKRLNELYKEFPGKCIHRIDAILMAYYARWGNFDKLNYKKTVNVLTKHFKKEGLLTRARPKRNGKQ